MSALKEPINKISRPNLSKVFQRKRLFQLLDENRKHPINWLSGPAALAALGRTKVECCRLRQELKNKAVFRP